MPIKRCCVKNCKSRSTRHEDKGVTYHKFPKDAKLCVRWTGSAQFSILKSVPPSFVCSRHFCKGDFKKNKDFKYSLKSDAVPSIFPCESGAVNMETTQSTEDQNEEENVVNISGSSKNSEVENLDNIKKFIEAQEKDLEGLKSAKITVIDYGGNITDKENVERHAENFEKSENKKNTDDETMAVASSVMEMILIETEAKASEYKAVKEIPKQTMNSVNSSMPLSVGSEVEAKDFSEEWYPAKIVEVDYDEMEVLVHYKNCLKKSDEWISVSSPRLRPFNGANIKPEPKPTTEEEKPTELLKLLAEVKEDSKEIKSEDKSKVYVVGERCLARFRDNRRFVATIDKDFGDGKFEVIFDDGFRWPCSISRLSKLKDTRDILTIDPTASPNASHSPILEGGPSTSSLSPVPTYHTHLFDPTRDYLGSKSERREKKRKLNIKEIFNIGQKKPKMPKIEKDKIPAEKRVVKKTVKPKVKVMEVKLEKLDIHLPDAVASILETVATDKIKPDEEEMSAAQQTDVDSTEQADESLDAKSDLDLVEEEDRLERFDKPDQVMHDEVIDKMKEAISKLEGGLIEDTKLELQSPKSQKNDSPITVIDLKPVDSPSLDIEPPQQITVMQEPDSENPQHVIESPMPDTEISILTEELTVGIETPTDIEVSVADVPSPSIIEASEFNIERIVPNDDDDLTKSDIDMGGGSPQLEIDAQPIIVDIEAPLDNDQPDSPVAQGTKIKKIKKLRLKDFEKNSKKKVKKSMMKKKAKKDLGDLRWSNVDRVTNELFEMKNRMKLMMMEIEREKRANGVQLPESALLPNEWACHWLNGQPVGQVSEIEADAKPDANGKPALPRRSVEVVDKRLPPGWTKHMVRRSVGHSAGKWDVVLVNPENRRFHTKLDMRNYLETADESIKAYEYPLMDFGVHLKLARKMGWISSTPDGATEAPVTILAADSKSCLSPLVKRKSLSLKRRAVGKLKDKDKKRPIKIKFQRRMHTYNSQLVDAESETSMMATEPEQPLQPVLEDGYVWVGSLKVQVIENLLRCPAEGCVKNFRNNTLLQMHIKHYHIDLISMMGATPKVLDLAAARTKPTGAEPTRPESKGTKVKVTRPPKRDEPKHDLVKIEEPDIDIMHHSPTKDEMIPKIPRSQDSPKLRNALINKPVRRPRVLLPIRKSEPEPIPVKDEVFETIEPSVEVPPTDVLDFETAISTHTVTKPAEKKKKGDKRQKSFAAFSKNVCEDEELFAFNYEDIETRSSYPRPYSPDDSKIVDSKTGLMMSSDTTEDQMEDPSSYTFTETGERIKIVHMKREEIINCHCGFREEDGLMVQCELCLCWQHALCHNIQKESDVPEKYTCSICLNPRRGRRSKRFLHDQDRLYEGLLPGAKPDESLRRSHELAGNLLRIGDALHALRIKCYVATKKDHPKLYLWASDWEQTEMTYKLNSEYSNLNTMINGIGKDMPMKTEDPHLMDMRPSEDDSESDRFSQRDSQLSSQGLLSGLLSSPSTTSLELPISTSELERLAKSVQEAAADWQGPAASAPQPEPPIENEVCRKRLLKHIQRCQALVDSRLDSIEAQVAELESQDPSFGEHYETAEHYPRIKQTMQMLMRDLDTMEELGVIT